MIQDDGMLLFQESFDQIIASSYLESLAETSESLHNQVHGNNTHVTTPPAFDTNTPTAQLQNVLETGNITGTVPDLLSEMSSSTIAMNGTVDPAMLNLGFGDSHHEVVQGIALCQSTSHLSSLSTALKPSAELEEQVKRPAGSRKRVRSNEKTRAQDISTRKGVIGGHKRVRRAPPCSTESDSKLQDHLSQSLEESDKKCVKFMCDFYSATASADSMAQLKEVIAAMRHSNSWNLSREFSSIANIVRALDKLDAVQHSVAFFRRILLLRISHHRDQRMEEVQNQIQNTRSTRQSSSRGKVESIVIDMLTQEVYPKTKKHLEEKNDPEWRKTYEKERKKLQNRFQWAKNWRRAVELFGFGILALVPTGGIYQIQNQRHGLYFCTSVITLTSQASRLFAKDRVRSC